MSDKSYMDRFVWLVQIFLLSFVYFVSAKIGLSLSIGVEQVTLVWPPTGIAITALLIFGKKLWPGIFIGAFWANITTNEPFSVAFGIALGNTLEALFAKYLLDRFKFDRLLNEVSDFVKFSFLGAIIPSVVAATIGSTSLAFGGLIGWNLFISTWITWWFGDMVGAIIFVPLLLSFKDFNPFSLSLKKYLELFALIASTVFTSLLVFSSYITNTLSLYPIKYILFPFMIWAALRFGLAGAAFVTFLVSAVSILGFQSGGGPFNNTIGGDHIGLMLLQVLMVVFSTTSIVLAIAIEGKKKYEGRVRSSEKRFKSLIENSSDAIVLIEPSTVIKYASPSVKKIIGYEPSELENKSGLFLIYKEDQTPSLKVLSELVLKPNKVMILENRLVHKDGSVRWMEAVGKNLLFDPDVGAIVINFRDITERKKLDEAKSEFVSLAAHELRSPLSKVRWYSESLMKQSADKKVVSDYITEIYASTMRMTSLVNMLLNASKVELGTLPNQPEEIDLIQVTRDILETYKQEIKSKHIKIFQNYKKVSIPVFMDPGLVRIIIENLISNAIKYTPDLGRVEITMNLEGKEVLVKVKDSGIGIPEEQKKFIFTKLFRADNVKKQYPNGTGLGLYLVKAVVDKLGGEINFESVEGQGTEFIVNFPVKNKNVTK